MLDLQKLLDIYAALKAHDNEIMARRPAEAPRGAWRQENPSCVRSSFRVLRDGRSMMAHVNYDTTPQLWIYPLKGGKLTAMIDLRAPDAADHLAEYTLPAPGDMLNFEFAGIRKRIGLTQQQLAPLLELGSAQRVSEYERETNPRKIPGYIARLMRAYDEGYRPADWPPGASTA